MRASGLLWILRSHVRGLSSNGALTACPNRSSRSSSSSDIASCIIISSSDIASFWSSSSSTTTSGSGHWCPSSSSSSVCQHVLHRQPATASCDPSIPSSSSIPSNRRSSSSSIIRPWHAQPGAGNPTLYHHHHQQQQQQQQWRGLATHVDFDDIGFPGSQQGPQQQQQLQPHMLLQHPIPLPPPPRVRAQTFKVPVYACHLGYELDYQSFCVEFKFKSRSMGRDNALLEIEGELSDSSVLLGDNREQERPEKIMLIYRYGSVLFFNMREKERNLWLSRLQAYVKLPPSSSSGTVHGMARAGLPPQALRHDETLVVVRPELQSWSALEPDKIVVQALSVGNVRVIGHVLGQSVALDYYNSKVDEAIQLFTPHLRNVASTGRMHISERALLQLIAENSLLYTDVVTKIGLLDISQTAWMQDRYHELWQSLRTDYEIDRRFDAINRKLGPMLENAKFLLDIRAERKSVQAEWIIIGLICVEVAVNFYGHFFL